MLGDGLPCGRDAVSYGEARADLEQRLPVTQHQLIEDRPSRRVRQCFEDIAHPSQIGKRILACQWSVLDRFPLGQVSKATARARSSRTRAVPAWVLRRRKRADPRGSALFRGLRGLLAQPVVTRLVSAVPS